MQSHENTYYLTLGHTKVANLHLHDMTYGPAKVVSKVHRFRKMSKYKKVHCMTLDLGVNAIEIRHPVPVTVCGRCTLFEVATFFFVALRPKSTAMVMARRSVHLTTLFPG